MFTRARLLNIFILCLLIIFITQSCLSDSSHFATNTINEVKIDTTGMSELSVYRFDTLNVKPALDYEGSEKTLSYRWEINLEVSDTVYTTLSQSKNLSEPIAFKPTSTGRPHQLVYTVTDEETGIAYIMTWPLKIQ